MSARSAGSARRFLRKLRGRGATELRVRGLQLGRTWLERAGVASDVGEPTDHAFWSRLETSTRRRIPTGDVVRLLDEFRSVSENKFFAGLDDRSATLRELRRRWPSAETEIVGRADAILSGKFDLLGYDGLSFGDPIDWHADPLAKQSAPRLHWSRIKYLDQRVVGDHKVIWELNRHQYFVTLGRAFWLTGNGEYARAIARHLVSWMDANPPKIGVNWASSLELSYRALSWLWALHFLGDSSELSPPLFRRMLAYLDLHARHVENNLSTYFSPNTHLTGEALGLFVLGSCLPMLARADRWRATGKAILEEHVNRQIRPDGVYVEQSPYYQRYTLEIYLHAICLAQRFGDPVRGVEPRLHGALEHAMFLTAPDGTFPLIGDDDGGQLLSLDGKPANDFRPSLSTAAALFGRADYAAVAGGVSEQTLWLLGPRGLEAFDRLKPRVPDDTSRGFADGGVYVSRDSWSPDSNYMVVDAGPHGFLTGGHAHADALSFVLSVAGKPLFVDPGTFAYITTGTERDYFRGSTAHNTITVDGKSSSEPGPSPFQWAHSAQTDVACWITGSRFDFLRAGHDGFNRLPSPVRHERSVLYIKPRYWVIRDRILGRGTHEVSLHFHCAPDVRASIDAEGAVVLTLESADETRQILLATFARDGSYSMRDDWVCPEYGSRVRAKTCTFRLDTNGNSEIVTFIAPSTEPRLHVTQSARGVFEVVGKNIRDTHCIGVTEDGGEVSDSWMWIRRDEALGTVTERFLVDEERPMTDGAEITGVGTVT